MSTLKVNRIEPRTGDTVEIVGLDIPEPTESPVKAWVNFHGGAGAVAIRESFNVSSVTEISNGQYSVNFENEMPKYEDVAGFCKAVTIKDIEEKKFILNPGRYVGTEEIADDGEPFEDKMRRLTSAYTKLSEESKKLDVQVRKNLKEIGYEI